MRAIVAAIRGDPSSSRTSGTTIVSAAPVSFRDGNECVLLLPPRDAEDWELWTYHPECGFTTGYTFLAFMEQTHAVANAPPWVQP
ncbi:MAG: hypothetical protein AB7L28_02730 [Kofleriaceae bacterium]